jgi:hypothetical protein
MRVCYLFLVQVPFAQGPIGWVGQAVENARHKVQHP